MSKTKMREPGRWEISYRNAGKGRLWPQAPTIQMLDLSRWRSAGLNSVLDAGCGDGKNLAYLVQQGFFVVGADASASALEKCRFYLQEQNLHHGYLLLAPTPLHKLPFVADSFDAAICVDVLGHLEEPIPILRELSRAIRPGGLLYASTFHVDDGCRTGPRMRPCTKPGQFRYRPSASVDVEYYFHFYDEVDARKLFDSCGMRLESIISHRWDEPPHLGYRDEPHTHQSWFALLRKGM